MGRGFRSMKPLDGLFKLDDLAIQGFTAHCVLLSQANVQSLLVSLACLLPFAGCRVSRTQRTQRLSLANRVLLRPLVRQAPIEIVECLVAVTELEIGGTNIADYHTFPLAV